MPWISKKAKAQIRARRKKKEKSSESSKERKLDQEDAEPSKNWDVIHKNVVSTVTIPSTATSKEARKIRKDARREARKEGRDESLIKFVDENGNSLSSDDKNPSNDIDRTQEDSAAKEPPRKKRKKSSFPCINKLLEEAEVAKRAQKEKEKQEAYENSIPDEIKKSYVALDCEMVGIGIEGKQSALARVSITDWNGEVLLDTFVQVPDRVTDFRTHVSGVRAKDIKFTNENAMELHACRKKVAEIIKNKILVGHSLKNDFAALMLDHPKSQIRDTARYKPFMRASGRNGGKLRPRKLRDLVKEHVGLIIQKEGQAHTSVEDAQATMKLYKVVREQWEKEVEKDLELKKKRKR
jgi:RNA exonuclease 4